MLNNQEDTNENEGKERLLQKDILNQAQELIGYLEGGDVTSARKLIGNLNQVREDSLYLELGKLTRELHDTLRKIDADVSTEEVPYARNPLSYVIKLTEEAANKTMDGIEATIPMSDDLAKSAKELSADWGRFQRREMSVDEFKKLYDQMMKFLASVESTADNIHDNLREVLVAQNYQDLTGQAIKKVIATVSSLEKRLVDLVAIAAEANANVGQIGDHIDEADNAQDQSKKKEQSDGSQVVSGQDEVDDLLSSLGF